jgi:hypothetical protein
MNFLTDNSHVGPACGADKKVYLVRRNPDQIFVKI